MSTVFSGGANSTAEEPKGLLGKFFKTEKQATIAGLAVIALLAIIAYSSVLFNWFAGDDFVHLAWLKDAVKNPELIVRNFHSSWLDGTTTKFYRPLISVFMVTDYLICGPNGISFHITNLLFLLTSSTLLFFIVRDIHSTTTDRQSFWFPLMAAGLFALYPLHPEAVAWITGRVDDIVTTFVLASFWCYIRWRSNKGGGLVLSLLFLVLGLTSKEMAITLPAVFLLYELVIKFQWKIFPGVKDIVEMVKPTIPFWLLLVAYFGVRYWALGTFVGGYDDNLTFISNPKEFIAGWLHGLKMLFVPVNRTLMGDHNAFTIGWEITLGSMFVLGVVNALRNLGLARCAAFFIIWTAFCLAPVYKIFAIADDMQGSRLAFLATVPICCGLALAFADSGMNNKWLTYFKRLLFVAAWVFATAILSFNNGPWAQAGNQANAIRKGLAELYSTLPGDPQVMLVGLPDEIHGAYVSRNAVAGMTMKPQFPRTVQNCLMVNRFEPILPVGFLKNSIATHRDKITIARWNSEKLKFDTVPIPKPEDIAGNGNQTWKGKELAAIAYGKGETKLIDDPSGSITVQGSTARTRPTLVLKPKNLPSFNTDFLQVNVKSIQVNGNPKHTGADLIYSNDLLPDTDYHNRVHTTMELQRREDFHNPPPAPGEIYNKAQQILFPLRAWPDFALGGQVHEFEILFPEGSTVTIESVEIIPAKQLMPVIDFAKSDFMGTKGFLHLGKDTPEFKVSFDASGVKNAAGIQFEITRANLLFEDQNTAEPSRVTNPEMTQISNQPKGELTLERKNFRALGLYEGRAWAIDTNGNRIGIAGDHIVIAVDS
ncbi:MAG TPA: hypothetical protein V6C76_15350 [Drouetiella sp.]